MNVSDASASHQPNEELRAIYDGSADGIIIVQIHNRRFIRANRAISRMLGYTEEELLTLSIDDIHPRVNLPHVLDIFKAMSERRLKCGRNVPCLRKDGGIIQADITVAHIVWQGQPCIIGFLHDVTDQKRAMEALRASDERYRLIADNVADVIWKVEFAPSAVEQAATGADVEAVVDAIIDQWRFSFVSPAGERLFKYTPDEIAQLSLRDITMPAGVARIREAIIDEFNRSIAGSTSTKQQRFLEVEFLAKGGVSRWCEVASTFVRGNGKIPTGALGITRDVTARRQAEKALRESEGKLRSLFENLPNLVMMVDQNARILFVNRDQANATREALLGDCAFSLITPEYQNMCRRGLEQAISTGQPQAFVVQDIVALWWSCQVVPIAGENGIEQALVICTNITQERLAVENIKKEQQLLRRLLDLHERERQLIAYEIHDGFAQHLAGALFRLQGFRETFAANPAEAWKGFDSATHLLSQAIDQTRRLISGLRPPILDELGVVEAIQYLVYEHRQNAGPEIEFGHEMTSERLPPPLENAIFRIVQESLNNACRHSQSDRIHVSLIQRSDGIRIDVRDWGVGFDPGAVAEQRFGLQGIRERVRLLDGRVNIESLPDQGTHISVELPLVGMEIEQAVIFDMDGVLVDTYHAHYQSWLEMAKPEGLHFSEAEFAAVFGRTSREIISHFWGDDRYNDAQIIELDQRKEAAFRRIIEADFPAMPGAFDLLHSLHNAGFRLAVGSSGPPENVALVLERLDVRDLFDVIVTGEDVTHGKPDPEVFLIAAKRLGTVPANCAVIEDAPAGVAAANAAGMTSIGLLSTGRQPEDLAAARTVVQSLNDLSPQVLHDVIARFSPSNPKDMEPVS